MDLILDKLGAIELRLNKVETGIRGIRQSTERWDNEIPAIAVGVFELGERMKRVEQTVLTASPGFV